MANAERRTSERKSVKSEMEFIFYLDAFKAKTVDLSGSGIRFETEKPIIIRLQVNHDGRPEVRDAQLVWAQKDANGKMTYGFEFIPDQD